MQQNCDVMCVVSSATYNDEVDGDWSLDAFLHWRVEVFLGTPDDDHTDDAENESSDVRLVDVQE